MKKIGVLYGMEQSFPPAIVDKINEIGVLGIEAELISVGALPMDQTLDYNVIFDRVSAEVAFFNSMLKNAVLNGVRVVNNPFWGCADDNFFHASLGTKIGINIPKTVLLPSKEHPPGSSSESMRNLLYPLNWDEVFEYVGFPGYLKPNKGNGMYNAYKVYNKQEFFSAFDLTGYKTMVYQEALEYEEYYRCYVIGKKDVNIMKYDPNKPQHLRYSTEKPELTKKMASDLEKICIKICEALGFDFNAVEFAICKGEIYAVDFLNPLPNAERAFLKDENFEWVVEKTAEFLISLAKEGRYRTTSYNWSKFLRGPKSAAGKRRLSKLKK